MASKTAVVKSSSEATSAAVDSGGFEASKASIASNAVESTPAPAAAVTADTPATDATLSSKSKMSEKDKSTPSTLPSISGRPRRGSSDEFGAVESLGSIAGSAVGYGGSSVGYDFSLSGGGLLGLGVGSNGSSHDKNSSSKKDGSGNKDGISVNNNKGISSSNGNGSNNIIGILNNRGNLKFRTSPTGRRPFRKRKASVDFSFPALSIDDSDSSYTVSQLLPQHQGTSGSATKGPMAAAGLTVSSSSVLMLPSNANRSRFYSDLTIPESLLSSTPKNNSNSSASSKQQKQQQQQQQKQQQRQKDNSQTPKEDQQSDIEKEQKLSSADALPSMEDDALPPIDNDAHSLLLNHPHSPISHANQTTQSAGTRKERAMSFASVHTQGHGVDRLDSLGVEATISASRIRKGSSVESDNKSHRSDGDNNSYDGTLGSQSHRFLMEAFLGDGTESLVLNPSQRERLGSFDAAAEVTGRSAHGVNKDNHGNSHNSNILISRERLSSIGGRRNRLESWGGMSDLSVGNFKADQNLESLGVGIFTGDNKSHGNNSGSGAGANSAAGPTDKTAALAATIYTSLANDVTGAANADENESVSSFLVHDEKIPSRISVSNRDRLNSMASIGTDASALLRYTAMGGDNIDAEFPTDVHTLIQAHMSSVEDQLADLATAVEAVSKDTKVDQDSELSSTASPMIGAASDVGSNRSTDSFTGRPRSASINSLLQISVDYDAVAAAVHAAEAAAGCLDLSAFSIADGSSVSSVGSHKRRTLPTQKKGSRGGKKNRKASSSSSGKKRASATELLLSSKRQCVASSKTAQVSNPGTNTLSASFELKTPLPKAPMDSKEMERLRERARAAAGYIPPAAPSSAVKGNGLPPRKRNANAVAPTTPLQPPRPSAVGSGSNFKTPTISNTATSKSSATPVSAYSSGTPASSTKGQSSQKWESMFECLLQFIDQRKTDATAGMTEAQKSEWIWDGNVPTTYKTKDGKALGRWVNNQRSAKSKGTLKEEREKRLVDAGLKWSVLASNSWNEMLEELRIYVAEQNNQGKKWDGNVPTNYRIKVMKDKAKPFVKDDDEDKNLGRWVNRQRSMFQAGKLRKDRQLALEKIGLKWSMLATTSWESMFETLCQYIKEKQKGGNEWDGNVPANYRTEDNPPRALGRWINRQRSAYGKSKLKPECVAKLNEIGLKWSIHERRPTYHQYKADATKSGSSKTPETAKSSAKTNAAKPVVVQSAATPATAVIQPTTKPSPLVVQSAAQPATALVKPATKPTTAAATMPVASTVTRTVVQTAAANPVPLVVQSAAKTTTVKNAATSTPTVLQTTAKPATVVQTVANAATTAVQTPTKPTTTVGNAVVQSAPTPASIVAQNTPKSTPMAVQAVAKPAPTAVANSTTIAVTSAAKATTTVDQTVTQPTSTVVKNETTFASSTALDAAKTKPSVVQNATKPSPAVEQNATKPSPTLQNTATIQHATKPAVVVAKATNASSPAAVPVARQSVGTQQQAKADPTTQLVQTDSSSRVQVEVHSTGVSNNPGPTVCSSTQSATPREGPNNECKPSITDPNVVVESNKPPPTTKTNGNGNGNGNATASTPTPVDTNCLQPVKEEQKVQCS